MAIPEEARPRLPGVCVREPSIRLPAALFPKSRLDPIVRGSSWVRILWSCETARAGFRVKSEGAVDRSVVDWCAIAMPLGFDFFGGTSSVKLWR